MKFGIVLSCYDKVDDLLVHLDILKFNRLAPKIAVIYMHHDQPPVMPRGVELITMPSPGFSAGPLMSVTRGIRWAAKNNLDYMVFKNADDWMFNHELAYSWLEKIASENKIAGGYSWLSVDSMRDVTLNENIFDVDYFLNTVSDAESYFLKSDQTYGCEYKLAWWINRATKYDSSLFYRLPDREQEPGIGWEVKDIPAIYEKKGIDIPSNLPAKLESNSRFFNRKWQLIGSHDNVSRYFYWNQIRKNVPYADQLEESEEFGRWINAVKNGLQWNKPSMNESRTTRLTRVRPIRTRKELPRILVTSKVYSH
jgi:hypothetical protein